MLKFTFYFYFLPKNEQIILGARIKALYTEINGGDRVRIALS